MGDAPDAGRVAGLIRDYGERAFKFAYRLTGDVEEAKDLVQEAYRKVLSRWETFDPDEPLANWFFTILRHLYLDGSRRAKTRDIVSLDSPIGGDAQEPLTVGDAVAGPEEVLEALERRESREAVRRALAALPRDQRATVMLCDGEGLSYEEIGRVLGCPPGTVRSRLSRARVALRALLEKEVVNDSLL